MICQVGSDGQVADKQEVVRIRKTPVLEIDYCGYNGRRTKGILGGPKSWGPKKKSPRSKCTQFFRFLLSAVGGQSISRTGRITPRPTQKLDQLLCGFLCLQKHLVSTTLFAASK